MKCLVLANMEPPLKGLGCDALILQRLLVAMGHTVELADWRDRGTLDRYAGAFDLALVTEVLDERQREVLRSGGSLFYLPNPEWHTPAKSKLLDQVDRVLCKTEDAARVMSFSGKACFIGFESEDLGEPAFAEPVRFLHPAGGSLCRGTAAVLRGWICAQQIGLPREAHLTVVDPAPAGEVQELLVKAQIATPDRVTVYGRLGDSQFRALQRLSAVHVLASEYEGWGHLFWEALGLGARVLGTDGPWWSAARGGFDPIPARAGGVRFLGQEHHVDARQLAALMVEAGQAPKVPNLEARRLFEQARDGFRARLAELVASIPEVACSRT